MDQRELPAWLWPKVKDRLAPPEGWHRQKRWRWLLDGKRADAFEVWESVVEPALAADPVELSFPQNYWEVTMVIAGLRSEMIEEIGRRKHQT